MTTLGNIKFSTPQVEIGEIVDVIAGDETTGAVIANSQGKFCLSGSAVNINDFYDLYRNIGFGVGLSPFRNVNSNTFTQAGGSFTASLNDITYGTGLFVAVGRSVVDPNQSANGLVYTSANGINWTTRSPATNREIFCVTYNNGLFVYGGANGTLATSTDAITWTSRTSGLSGSSSIVDIIYGNGLYVFLHDIGTLFTNAISTSTDAITWTTRTTPSSALSRSLCYGNGVFVYLSPVNSTVVTSTNAINWSSAALGGVTIVYGNGIFVNPTNSSTYRTSTDAITWTNRTFPNGNTSFIMYTNGFFISFNQISTTGSPLFINHDAISTSTDAITWGPPIRHNFTANTFLRPVTTLFSSNTGVVYGNGLYVTGTAVSSNLLFLQSNYFDSNTQFAVPPFNSSIKNFSITFANTGTTNARFLTYVRSR